MLRLATAVGAIMVSNVLNQIELSKLFQPVIDLDYEEFAINCVTIYYRYQVDFHIFIYILDVITMHQMWLPSSFFV